MAVFQPRNAAAMDNIVYTALCHYFHLLCVKGYVPWPDMVKLLILVFYWEYSKSDFRGNISREDYRTIERALNCLYGSSCLIPYPNYPQMGKLYIGDISEIMQRMKAIEDTKVVKLMNPEDAVDDIESDVVVVVNTDDSSSGS